MAHPFARAYSVDFEYRADPGCRPHIWCMSVTDPATGKTQGWWRNELLAMSRAPFPTDRDSLMSSYAMSAEMSCFLELGWPIPEYLVDTYAEHRRTSNGRKLSFGGPDEAQLKKHKNGMLAAAYLLGIPTMSSVRKEEMRALAMTRWDFAPDEQAEMMRYCGEDTATEAQILAALEPKIDWPRALLRGRLGLATARMERTGVPIDVPLWNRLKTHWDQIEEQLIEQVDAKYGVYRDGHFDIDRFDGYLKRSGYTDWPRTATGKPMIDEDTLKAAARVNPELNLLKELRSTQSGGRLLDLSIGPDGYNRTGTVPFGTVTMRNCPSPAHFIFGPATWLRGFIMAKPGEAVAYLDYSAEEVCIAAWLSQCEELMEDCLSGDPYMAFAVRAGLAPAGANKHTHTALRDTIKVLFLSLNYGRNEYGLAEALGKPIYYARYLMRLHRRAYPKLYTWFQGVINTASLRGILHSPFGWQRYVPDSFNSRSIRNWPCQTLGAEILMLACILLTEAGIEVCCPVHDAVLIKAPIERVDAVVEQAKHLMRQAAIVALEGFPIEVDAKPYPHGTRYMDKRGAEMWNRVMGLLDGVAGPVVVAGVG